MLRITFMRFPMLFSGDALNGRALTESMPTDSSKPAYGLRLR